MASSGHKRLVAYWRERGVYLKHDCLGYTPSRVYAWSGSSIRVARNMIATFPAAESCQIYLDGDEHAGSPVDVS